jgi:hypothetical protein
MSFYLHDGSGNTWEVVVSDGGVLDQIPVSPETASASTINDVATNTTSWLIGISTTGRLSATSQTYSGSNPTSISVTAPEGGVWQIVINSTGVISTRSLAPAGQYLVITWQRRTRIGGAWLDGTGEVPLSEDSELYDVEICDDSGNVLRTISDLTTPTAIYTSAMQIADFGFQPASVLVNVYQKSAQVGRGFRATGRAPAPGGWPAPWAEDLPGTTAGGGQLFYVNGT